MSHSRRWALPGWIWVVCALSLVVAACGGEAAPEPEDPTPQTTPTTQTPTTVNSPTPATTSPPTTATTTTTTTTLAPREYEPTPIFYRYPSGEVQYAISMEQEALVMLDTVSEEELFTGPIETTSLLEGTLTYGISPGPEEGTITIRITSDLTLVESTTTVGGFTVPTPDDSEVPGLETDIDLSIVVDAQGNVLEVLSEGDNELGDLLSDGGLFPDSWGNQPMERPFGPVFPDGPLEVGDTWSYRTEEGGLAGMDLVVTDAEHTLVDVEHQADRLILVIESAYRTGPFEWDISEMLQGLLGVFGGDLGDEDGGEQDATEIENAIPQMEVRLSVGPTTTSQVTRFDVDGGLVLEGESVDEGEVTTHMALPDGSGEIYPIVSTVSYVQTLTYRLISPAA